MGTCMSHKACSNKVCSHQQSFAHVGPCGMQTISNSFNIIEFCTLSQQLQCQPPWPHDPPSHALYVGLFLLLICYWAALGPAGDVLRGGAAAGAGRSHARHDANWC